MSIHRRRSYSRSSSLVEDDGVSPDEKLKMSRRRESNPTTNEAATASGAFFSWTTMPAWNQLCQPPTPQTPNSKKKQRRSTALSSNFTDTDYDDDAGESTVNPYRMLQVRKDATQSEIKQAYRRQALLYHPGRMATHCRTSDKQQQSPASSEQERRQQVFAILAACCETLLERESRSRLDLLLKGALPRRGSVTASNPPQHHHHHHPIHRRRHALRQKSLSSISDIPILDLSQTVSSSSSSDSEDELEFENSQAGCCQWPSMDWFSTCSNNDTTTTTAKRDKSNNSTNNPSSKRRSSFASSSVRSNSEYQKLSSAAIRQQNNHDDDDDIKIHTMSSGGSATAEEQDRVTPYNITKAERDQMFGDGPLSILYQARLYRPFSDPFQFFDRVFGSAVFPIQSSSNQQHYGSRDNSHHRSYHTSRTQHSDCATPVRNHCSNTNATTTPQQPQMIVPLSSSLPPIGPLVSTASFAKAQRRTSASSSSHAWTRTLEASATDPSTTIYTTSRVLPNGRRIIKRETVTMDPTTGKKRSSINVTSEEAEEVIPRVSLAEEEKKEQEVGYAENTNKETPDGTHHAASPTSVQDDCFVDLVDLCNCYWDCGCCGPVEFLCTYDPFAAGTGNDDAEEYLFGLRNNIDAEQASALGKDHPQQQRDLPISNNRAIASF